MIGLDSTRQFARELHCIGIEALAKGNLNFKFDLILLSIGWNMLYFNVARQFARTLNGKLKFTGFGLDTQANGSLGFKFGWILISKAWDMLDFTDSS